VSAEDTPAFVMRSFFNGELFYVILMKNITAKDFYRHGERTDNKRLHNEWSNFIEKCKLDMSKKRLLKKAIDQEKMKLFESDLEHELKHVYYCETHDELTIEH
jgi:hypothetical protein